MLTTPCVVRVVAGRRRVGGFGESCHVAQVDRAVESKTEIYRWRQGNVVQVQPQRDSKRQQYGQRRDHRCQRDKRHEYLGA